ncbi:MAG: DUF1918 domain-containing protein [Acidimicrobiia bacterium]
MNAQKGDRLVIRGHHVGDLDRDGEILEVGEHGGPPYLVRWSDDGHEGLIFPSSDAVIRHPEPRRGRHPKSG